MPESPRKLFRKVLVANRGEIAVRVIRALRELDIRSVAIFSEADRAALHVQMADEAVCVGPAASLESYLSVPNVLAAAKRQGAEAIHPGYGFLSENAGFAQACADAGIKFIGPSADAIARMGSKIEARRVAIDAGAPVVPGTEQKIRNLDEARSMAATIGYPVLLKASAGGGGKGMRRVDRAADLESAIAGAASEAERAFGSGEVYLEKLIERPRHIEVQILGDEQGNLIHLGERECSIQRRHQKVVEECPSPLSSRYPRLRDEIGEAALKIARRVNYASAGTLEFLADQSGRFYFLEMNTRLQVEHPVTELVTGIDLVRRQILIAAGHPLALRQPDVTWNGHAMECRVYAEDPDNNFFPSAGKLAVYEEPSGPGVRSDSGAYEGWTVPIEYDPLLAKLSVWSNDRASAIARMRRALHEYRILGITSNLPLFNRLLQDKDFQNGDLDTGFLERFMAGEKNEGGKNTTEFAAALLAGACGERERESVVKDSVSPAGEWRTQGRQALMREGRTR